VPLRKRGAQRGHPVLLGIGEVRIHAAVEELLRLCRVPHQGGEHHVNEQPPEYWRERFAKCGYQAYDWLRPRLADKRQVKPWYRFNSFLYANAAGRRRLSKSILAAKVPDGEPLEIGGDLSWLLRRTAVRLIPTSLVKPIAMAKASLEARLRK